MHFITSSALKQNGSIDMTNVMVSTTPLHWKMKMATSISVNLKRWQMVSLSRYYNTPKYGDGTALYDLCMSMVMDSTNTYRDIIIFTDGMDNCSHISLKTLTEVMQQHGTRVNVVSINSEKDSVLITSQALDCLTVENKQPLKSELLFLTNETGGVWVKCKNRDEMKKIVKRIATIPYRPYKRKKASPSTEWLYDRLRLHYLMKGY